MQTYFQARTLTRTLPVILRVSAAVGLLSLSAKLTVILPNTPVPLTFQVLGVLLIGLTLGVREGAASVLGYLAAIALGVPLDASGVGAAAFVRPTAGYLIAFLPAVMIAGLGRGGDLVRAFALNCAAVAVIYLGGWLVMLSFVGDARRAFALGVVPFIAADFGKALLAAALVRLARESRLRWRLW